MKTLSGFTSKNCSKTIGLIITLLFISFSVNSTFGQTQAGKTIKGIISDEEGPLESVSVVLKDSNLGTTTNDKGEFTFPELLAVGDILQITYLGYKTVEVTIKEDTSFLRLVLAEDLIEFVGAVNTDKPYKTKRKNRK